jgi:Arc/MetJ-type ribon-helix-helix transcriptional regulator
MTITLSPEQEQLIAQAMESGAYQRPDEVVARALDLLQSEDEWLRGMAGEIDRKIDRATAQFESGQYYTAEESRADMERRKAAWLAERQG